MAVGGERNNGAVHTAEQDFLGDTIDIEVHRVVFGAAVADLLRLFPGDVQPVFTEVSCRLGIGGVATKRGKS